MKTTAKKLIKGVLVAIAFVFLVLANPYLSAQSAKAQDDISHITISEYKSSGVQIYTYELPILLSSTEYIASTLSNLQTFCTNKYGTLTEQDSVSSIDYEQNSIVLISQSSYVGAVVVIVDGTQNAESNITTRSTFWYKYQVKTQKFQISLQDANDLLNVMSATYNSSTQQYAISYVGNTLIEKEIANLDFEYIYTYSSKRVKSNATQIEENSSVYYHIYQKTYAEISQLETEDTLPVEIYIRYANSGNWYAIIIISTLLVAVVIMLAFGIKRQKQNDNQTEKVE